MSTPFVGRYTAFEGNRVVSTGALVDVALAIRAKAFDASLETILVFDDVTGAVVDLDLRGSPEDISLRFAQSADRQTAEPGPPRPSPGDRSEADTRGRGRPKLGVVAREITLLPRQWEWLASQPGGASQTLRRLVDEGRRASLDRDQVRVAREAAYRFMSAMAGNLPGFEASTRALFSGSQERFEREITGWPADVSAYALRLAMPGFPAAAM